MKIDINNKIQDELSLFISNLENRDKVEKNFHHYRSVVNLANGLLLVGDYSSIAQKKSILNYLEAVKDLDYMIDQHNSLELYKNFILPVGQYLTKRRNFRSKWDILKYLVVGIIIDLVLMNFVLKTNYFVFTPVLVILGYIRRKIKIKKNEYFSIHW